eukprot:TRINITY_DN20429_c0_g1_i1.p1 TRINITY_DN20429_c0_g1~~TRINITY_DN20429_c0_g1_i1.p1  ORF type:complete len:689 (+),score=150.50 TRINITY_DN20429_c0_g1_i1:251-2068(+)
MAIARTVCHEIAHMWFGNLVTMEWWTYLWLNEGFARYCEFLAVDALFPSWNIWNIFQSDVFAAAMRLDSLSSSHPVEVPVIHPSEINEIFDTISYAKGASIIRMLAIHLGADKFKEGLSHYLKKFAYKNARTEDLWECLSLDFDVADLMREWVQHTGYPVVQITESKNSNGETVFQYSQHRFFFDGRNRENSEKSSWLVPLTVQNTYSEGSQELSVLLKESGEVRTGKFEGEYIATKFNYGHASFCRVCYTPEMLEKLSETNPSHSLVLSVVDSVGLVSDLFALSRAGYIPAGVVLDFCGKNFANCTDAGIFSILGNNVMEMRRVFDENFTPKLIGSFLVSIYFPIYQKMTYQVQSGVSLNTGATMLYQHIVEILATLGNDDVLDNLERNFDSILSRNEEIPIMPELRLIALCAIIQHRPRTQRYDQLKRYYLKCESSEEKRRCLQALGKHKSEEFMARTLEFALSSDVRSQDVAFAISGVAGNSNPKGREICWAWLQQNWTEINTRFGVGNFLLSSILATALSSMSTFAEADAVESFFAANPAPLANRTIQQRLEAIRSAASWREREVEEVTRWSIAWFEDSKAKAYQKSSEEHAARTGQPLPF